MRRRAKLLAGFAACCGVACSKLAGLGDPPAVRDDGDAQAVVVASDALCRQCESSKCGAQAAACSASTACNAYEECLVPCLGDYACRSRCLVQSYASAESIPAMDQCVSAQCASECGLGCGMTSVYSEPDAAASCQQCLTASACDTAVGCGADLGCQQITQCTLGCVTQDCFFTCAGVAEGGAGSFIAYVAAAEKCAEPCGAGDFWDCATNDAPPLSMTGQTVITLSFVDFPDGNRPVAGATVKACALADTSCAAPVVPPGVTDAQGNVTFTLAADGIVGFNGYFDVSSSSIYPSLLFLQAPLSVPRVTLPAILVPEPSVIAGFYATMGATADPSKGVIEVQTTDCHWGLASDVAAQVAGDDAGASFAYFLNGSLSPAATFTDPGGYAVLLDAPVGSSLTVSVTPRALGRAAARATIFARPGTWSFLSIHPI